MNILNLLSPVITGDPLHSRAHAHSRAPLFTQPCPHCSHSRAPGEQWARLCVFTLQGCVQAARLCRGSPVVMLTWGPNPSRRSACVSHDRVIRIGITYYLDKIVYLYGISLAYCYNGFLLMRLNITMVQYGIDRLTTLPQDINNIYYYSPNSLPRKMSTTRHQPVTW